MATNKGNSSFASDSNFFSQDETDDNNNNPPAGILNFHTDDELLSLTSDDIRASIAKLKRWLETELPGLNKDDNLYNMLDSLVNASIPHVDNMAGYFIQGVQTFIAKSNLQKDFTDFYKNISQEFINIRNSNKTIIFFKACKIEREFEDKMKKDFSDEDSVELERHRQEINYNIILFMLRYTAYKEIDWDGTFLLTETAVEKIMASSTLVEQGSLFSDATNLACNKYAEKIKTAAATNNEPTAETERKLQQVKDKIFEQAKDAEETLNTMRQYYSKLVQYIQNAPSSSFSY